LNVFIKKNYAAIVIVLLTLTQTVSAQSQAERDSMRKAIELPQADTSKVKTLVLLCFAYLSYNPDSTLYYGQKHWKLPRAANYPAGEVRALNGIRRRVLRNGKS